MKSEKNMRRDKKRKQELNEHKKCECKNERISWKTQSKKTERKCKMT